MPRLALLGIACAAIACGTSNEGGVSSTTTVTHDTILPPEDAGARYDAAYPKGDPGPPPPDAADASSVAPPPPAAEPLAGPDEQWTWIDIPEMRCADGSSSGVGVNFTHASDDLLIFLEGGGACWDASSCFGPIQTALNLGGYGKAEFASDSQIPPMPVLQRDRATNPFRAMSMVYFPYCTGDVHAGTRIADYDVNGTTKSIYHYGAKNFAVALERIKATFLHPKRVWIAGDSAGGFGAALNFPRVYDAFPLARVGVLDDSGQPISPTPERWAQWRASWGLKAPDGCPACDADIGAYVDYYRLTYPDNRFGLISYQSDLLISTFMGLGAADFQKELETFAAAVDARWPYAKYFFVKGSLHVPMVTGYSDEMDAWIQRLVSGDPAWASVNPQ